MATRFPFSDLQSFKDYVVFVQICSPDRFRPREGVGSADQWTLDLPFEGLRLGLEMASKEKGKQDAFVKGRALVEDAYTAYREGRIRDGFFKLEELQKVLRKVPSQ